MDLPPLQLEMVRFGLQGEPAHTLCRPVDGSVSSLHPAISGSAPCRREANRIRIDEPPGWPVLPPPPLTRESLAPAAPPTTSSATPPAALSATPPAAPSASGAPLRRPLSGPAASGRP